ncbi:QRFP-like peptide receptor [Mercenaria mercenaria]|uniref:QRFP-like peptide receptor n=1 Tax=Mercenaria mercenaria TaxID=6596 RepID=UPI00234F08E5|nr:QRFP-like peptide receptor [Mercenaria mercenaria]
MIRLGKHRNISAPVKFPAQKDWQIELSLLERNQIYTVLSDNTELSHRNDKMPGVLTNNTSLEYNNWINESVTGTYDNSSKNRTEMDFMDIPPLTAQDYVLVILYSVTTFLAIVGNSIAIVIFTKGKRSKTDLRPFLINLAVADLIMAIFCIPFTFTYQLLNSNWVFSRPMCPIVMFLQTVSVTGSVITNMVIGIDRLCAIAFPLIATRNRSLRYRLIILIIWIISVAFAGVQLKVGDTHYDKDTGYTECKENWSSDELAMFYTILVLILTYLVPVIILTVTYSIVGYILWKRNLPGNADASRDKVQLNSKVKIVKMLVTIVVLFVLCWLPLHTFFLVLNFTEKLDHASLSLTYFICHWIAMSNSFVNPIVYGTLNDSFRADLKQLIFRCIPIRTRAGTARQGAVKLKYPAEKYKLNYNAKRSTQRLNYQTQRSYESPAYDEYLNSSSFSRNASANSPKRTYDTSR